MAAGYFDVRRGGFLDVHIDFARNPKLSLVRRVNVLVYLNQDWEDGWGGELELWRSLDDGPVQRIAPIFNRMVVFSTPGAAHGHPAAGGRARRIAAGSASPPTTTPALIRPAHRPDDMGCSSASAQRSEVCWTRPEAHTPSGCRRVQGCSPPVPPAQLTTLLVVG